MEYGDCGMGTFHSHSPCLSHATPGLRAGRDFARPESCRNIPARESLSIARLRTQERLALLSSGMHPTPPGEVGVVDRLALRRLRRSSRALTRRLGPSAPYPR